MSTSSSDPASSRDGMPARPQPSPADKADPRREPAAAPEPPVARVADVVDPSQVRQAPRYGRFGLAGFLVGALLSLVLTFVPTDLDVSRGALFLVLLLGLGTAGVFGGLTWALVADRRSLRRHGQR